MISFSVHVAVPSRRKDGIGKLLEFLPHRILVFIFRNLFQFLSILGCEEIVVSIRAGGGVNKIGNYIMPLREIFVKATSDVWNFIDD